MRRLAHPARAFTLTELLIVMAVMSILSVVTLVSMRALSRDARLASAVNSVTASLDNARALAIREGRVVLLAFRPRIEGTRDVVVELVPCHWTGESYLNQTTGLNVIDRFIAIPDAPVRTLPAGVKVAVPWYGGDNPETVNDPDAIWTTQAHLPLTQVMVGTPEVPGSLIGVMYGPDGTTLSGNSQSDSDLIWADLVRPPQEFDPAILAAPTIHIATQDQPPGSAQITFDQFLPDEEPFVRIAPFIAVYDDGEARERSAAEAGVPAWTNTPVGRQMYQDQLSGPSGYISTTGRRIHFNVYTGVAMK